MWSNKKAEENSIECVKVEKNDQYHMTVQLLENIPQNTDLIILLGWLSFLRPEFIKECDTKIINVHPSLLPQYGGKGMYGIHVHEAVMKNKEIYTGCTVHYVTSQIDNGEIILQKKMRVDYSKTPWELGGEVFKLENEAVIDVIRVMISEKCKGEEK